MAFEILNEADSVLYVLAGENRYPQAEPDKVDFDILAQGVDGEGVVSGCLVTPQGAPDTTVAVAAGVVRIGGTDVAYAGGNVNCGAAHVGFPRFDLIAINNAGVASAIAGVAAEPPVFPAVPANSVIVAAVWRAANDNTITAADIVDKRCMLLGGALGTVPTLIGIVGGIATPNRSHHTLSSEHDAVDDLDGLAVSSIISNGEIVIIRPDAGDTITVKHNALGGADARNILCIGNADIVCNDDHDFVICIYASAIGAGSWMALGGGAGGGGTLDAAYDFGGAGAGRTIFVTDGSVLITNPDHDAGVPNLELARAPAYITEPVLGIRATGDAQFRFQADGNGTLSWGSGAGAADIVLSRAAVNRLSFAAGDILGVQYLADTAGNTRITLGAAAPHILLGTPFVGAIQIAGNFTSLLDSAGGTLALFGVGSISNVPRLSINATVAAGIRLRIRENAALGASAALLQFLLGSTQSANILAPSGIAALYTAGIHDVGVWNLSRFVHFLATADLTTWPGTATEHIGVLIAPTGGVFGVATTGMGVDIQLCPSGSVAMIGFRQRQTVYGGINIENRFAGAGGTIIGADATPAAGAMLEVRSIIGAFLLPRMTTVQRNALAATVNGMVIYNTTTNQKESYEAGAWAAN